MTRLAGGSCRPPLFIHGLSSREANGVWDFPPWTTLVTGGRGGISRATSRNLNLMRSSVWAKGVHSSTIRQGRVFFFFFKEHSKKETRTPHKRSDAVL